MLCFDDDFSLCRAQRSTNFHTYTRIRSVYTKNIRHIRNISLVLENLAQRPYRQIVHSMSIWSTQLQQMNYNCVWWEKLWHLSDVTWQCLFHKCDFALYLPMFDEDGADFINICNVPLQSMKLRPCFYFSEYILWGKEFSSSPKCCPNTKSHKVLFVLLMISIFHTMLDCIFLSKQVEWFLPPTVNSIIIIIVSQPSSTIKYILIQIYYEIKVTLTKFDSFYLTLALLSLFCLGLA